MKISSHLILVSAFTLAFFIPALAFSPEELAAGECNIYEPKNPEKSLNSTDVLKIASRKKIKTFLFDVGGALSKDVVGEIRRYLSEKFQNYGVSVEKSKLSREKADAGIWSDADYWRENLKAANVPRSEIKKTTMGRLEPFYFRFGS